MSISMSMTKISASLLQTPTNIMLFSIILSLSFWVVPVYSSSSSLDHHDHDHHYYNVGDKVPFFVNKVGPLNNPSETYEYFDLPFCQPEQLIRKKESLGEVLNGDRLINARYDIKFREDKEAEVLCTKSLSREEVHQFRDAVQRDFYFQMYYDDLPFWGFIGKVEEEAFNGSRKGSAYFLFTHVQFQVFYNPNHIVEVHAFSDPNHVVDISEDTQIEVQFTYSAMWNATSAPYAYRMNRYSAASLQSPVQQLHWFSIINSVIIIVLSLGLLSVLYWWNVKSDLRKFSTRDEDDKEAGWTCIDGGVLRCPTYLSLFCAVFGCGTQLFMVVCCLFTLLSLGFLELHAQGTLWTAIVLMYSATSAVAGYSAASLHCQFAEAGWERSVILTGILFAGPLLIVLSILNTVAMSYGATAALPFGTILLMFLIYAFVAVPLLALGGLVGHHYSCKNTIPSVRRGLREIPPLSWYTKLHSQMLLGGLLPFSGILVEIHLSYATLWSYKLFTSPGVLFFTFSILVILTVVLSIGLTYIQLSMEDLQWCWRSVLRGGSTAIFMFVYGLYFYAKSNMSGFMQLSFFLGYSACMCYAFFLMLAAIGFRSSLISINRICSAVKSE